MIFLRKMRFFVTLLVITVFFSSGSSAVADSSAEVEEGKLSPEEIKASAGEDPLMCALLVSETLPSLEWKTEIFSAVVEKYLEYLTPEEYDLPLKVANSIGEPGRKAESLASIAAQYIKNDEQDLGEETLSQSLEVIQGIEDPYTRGLVESKVIDNYLEVEQFEKALELAKTIENPYLKAKALTNVASNYREKMQKDKAREILLEALEIAKSVEVSTQKVEDLDAIAYELDQAGEHEKALEAVTISGIELGEIKQDMDEETKSEKAEAMLADLLELMDLLKDVEDTIANPEMGDSLEKSGESADEEERLARIEEDYQKAKSLEYLADRVTKLVEVGEKYHDEKMNEKAIQILTEAQETAKSITSPYSKGDLQVKILTDYLEMEQYQKALKLLGEIELPFYKAKGLIEIGGAYGKAEIEPSAEAKEILGQIVSSVK